MVDFFENANIGMFWVAPDGMVLWANQYQLDSLGYSQHEFIGKNLVTFFTEPAQIRDLISRLEKDLPIEQQEFSLRAKDGSLHSVLLASNVFRDNGKLIHARFFVRDITDRKRAEEALRIKEEELRLITNNVPALLAFIDKDHRYRFNNDTYNLWFGETPEFLYGKHLRDVIQDRPYEIVKPHLERALRGEQSSYEMRVPFRDGKEHYVLGTYTPRRNHDGEIEGVVAIVSDITESREAELKVRESEERFRMLSDSAPVMIWTAGPDKKREYFNKAWLEFTGKSLEENLGNGWQDRIHPDDRERFNKLYADAFLLKKSFRTEYRLQRGDGQYQWVLSQGVPRFRSDGVFLGFIGSVVNIQDRKIYEGRIRFLAEISSLLYESLDYRTSLQNLASKLVPTYADWCTINLMSENNRIEMVAVAHQDPRMATWASEFTETMSKEAIPTHQIATVLRTGQSQLYQDITDDFILSIIPDSRAREAFTQLGLTSAMHIPIKNQSRVVGVMTLIYANSGRKYSHQDIIFAEELARNAAIAIENATLYQKIRESDNAKTQFLSMLAHELRNPMAPILSSLELLHLQAKENQDLQDTVQIMSRQLRQMGRLLDDLLDVSRIIHSKIKLAKKEIDLNIVATYAIETTRALKEEFRHTLSVSLPSRPVILSADPVRIEQIIVNLLNNAYKYTEPGGTIWLTVTEQNSEAVIRVKDTGIGLASHMIPKIFELFGQADNSLSRSYGGMGIGLTLVKSLVEMHDGTISVESAGPGKGSEFIVRLPIKIAVQPQETFGFERETQPKAPLPKDLHRILVVDDNRDAAHALGKLLERLGHDVKYAYDGATALRAAREHQPSVVLLDIGLPEMNGYDVAKQLRKDSLFKNTLLVAVSGYGQEEDRIRSEEAGFDYHFTKPVGVDALNRILS